MIDPVQMWFGAAGMLASLVGIPLILRFGFRPSILSGLILLVQSSLIIHSVWEFELPTGGVPLTIAFSVAAALVAATWLCTYRIIGSGHPWRSGAPKLTGKMRPT